MSRPNTRNKSKRPRADDCESPSAVFKYVCIALLPWPKLWRFDMLVLRCRCLCLLMIFFFEKKLVSAMQEDTFHWSNHKRRY